MISQSIADLVRRWNIEVVHVDGLRSTQYVTDAGIACPAVVDLHDSLSLLYSRKVPLERSWIRRQALRAETRSLARWERSLGRDFSAVITNSPVDEAFIRRLNPTAKVLTIENGVDGGFFRPGKVRGDSRILLFTGVMSYGPNEDAALYFLESILPAVQAAIPEVRFQVVGRSPGPQIRELASRPGVEVPGEVPDVRPYLEEAGIFVCPLRWGAGVKNKVLAALAMGKPVVASSLSIEGLDLQDRTHLLIADDPAEFAERVIGLIREPARAEAMGKRGQEAVLTRYSWEHSARTLEGVLTPLVSPG